MQEELQAQPKEVPGKPRKKSVIVYGLIVCALILFFLVTRLLSIDSPPADFPVGQIFLVEEGSSSKIVAEELKANGYIRSTTYFLFVLKSKFDNSYVHAGSYTFTEPLRTTQIVEAITGGESLTPHARATFPEGFRVEDMHAYLPPKYKDQDLTPFIELEGYLFPDTYFIAESDTLTDIIGKMQNTFDEKTEPILSKLDGTGLQRDEVIILASIIEREANTEESMKLVSGILQTRLEIGMPLQVDAAFEYLLHKASHELTPEDLTIDSPYNTYENRGLPPTPISNPGLQAITAVLEPTPSEYLYYLTADDGTFYYAETFEEHKLNKARYLD